MERLTGHMVKAIGWPLTVISLCIFVLFTPVHAMTAGTYINNDQPGIKLDLTEDGDYDLWMEKGKDVIEIQLGKYTLKQNSLLLRPDQSDIGDMDPMQGKVVDECTIDIENGGIFKLENCTAGRLNKTNFPNAEPGNTLGRTAQTAFPKSWHIVKTRDMELYVPVDAKVKTTGDGVFVYFNNGEAGLSELDKNYLSGLVRKCNPSQTLNKAETTFYVCGQAADARFIQIVQARKKQGTRGLFSFVKAGDLSTLKALSIAISSIRPLSKKGTRRPDMSSMPQLVTWRPSDRSFSIKVPRGWEVHGGTADFGRNGYIRIVQAISPAKEAGFVGVYYPFYEYAQTSMGISGIPPMDARTYLTQKFFTDLGSQYHITFDDLHIEHLEIDRALSQKLTRAYNSFGNYGLSTKCEAVDGTATYSYQGKPYEMKISGIMSYSQNPMSGFGYITTWGPGPVVLGAALKGTLQRWEPVFSRMSESWQVDMNWLTRHLHMARADAQRTLSHFSKMRRIIHENSERRMNSGLREWEQEQNERMEEFWDTYYALGGEERYDDPVTGEEVDVPIGADKYLYDHLSQSWVGVRDDNPDADEIIQHLKEDGFRELKLHTH